MVHDRILIFQNDPYLKRLLTTEMRARGFEVRCPPLSVDPVQYVAGHAPHLVIVDARSPGSDDLEICARIRRLTDVPILVLAPSSGLLLRARAIQAGATDYLPKPFHLAELVSHVHALIRRHDGETAGCLRAGPLELDLVRREASLDGERLSLSAVEFSLLRELTHRLGETVTYDRLHQAGWGVDRGQVRRVQGCVSQLRRILGARPAVSLSILADPGAGYRLTCEEMAPAA